MTELSRREFAVSMLGTATVAVVSAAAPPRAGSLQPSTRSPGAASDALAGLTLAEASSRIRAGSVTPTELVNACLARIDVYNPKINAFITVTREHALAQAIVLEAEQRAGRLGGP